MFQQDPLVTARDRDLGLRRIGQITWRAGLAGIACSAVVAAAFGHHAAASTGPAKSGSVRQHSASQHRASQHNVNPHRRPTPIVIPAQPPQPASGSGQVTSGAS